MEYVLFHDDTSKKSTTIFCKRRRFGKPLPNFRNNLGWLNISFNKSFVLVLHHFHSYYIICYFFLYTTKCISFCICVPLSIGLRLNIAGLAAATGKAWCLRQSVITEHTLAKSPSNSGSSGQWEQKRCNVCTCFFVQSARRPASEMVLRTPLSTMKHIPSMKLGI